MSSVLDKIVENRKKRIAEDRVNIPVKKALTHSDKSLFDALQADNSQFIMECKKASPSKGLLRPEYNLSEIVGVYNRYASAISVLTEPDYFQGSYEHLMQVTGESTLPVLCKDFFVDAFQIEKARECGADAILLMLSVLNDAEYKQLATVAEAYKLDILTEVHSEHELQRALALGAKIIGINNRDLNDLSIDLATTENLARKVKRGEVVLISESGVEDHKAIVRLAPLVDGFLVGSSLMAADDLEQQCKRLLFGETKICGLTSTEQAQWAADSGAMFGGLIFHPESPRAVTLDGAKAISKVDGLSFVGVFVNHPVELVADYAAQLSLIAVQLHGQESDAYVEALRTILPAACQIWRAVAIENDTPPDVGGQNIDRFVYDSRHQGQFGGTGHVFDWEAVLKNSETEKVALAGGLSPDNIAAARAVWSGLLDINSGVESGPGVKNQAKIRSIYQALRQ